MAITIIFTLFWELVPFGHNTHTTIKPSSISVPALRNKKKVSILDVH
jgi:hypothetical protein